MERTLLKSPDNKLLAFIQGESLIEYAEEYSKPEKIKRILFAVLLSILLLIINEKWFLPFIDWFASTAHCHILLGYSGVFVLLYSMFVGIPLFFAIWIGAIVIPIGINGLIQGQFPPKDLKVYKPTLIIRGWKAHIKSIFHLIFPVLFVALSIWGYFQVDDTYKEVY